MKNSLDVLAFAAHPDDVEISAGGTVAKMVGKGYKLGIIDLTRGELGTRGSSELREAEAKKSASILGIVHRDNLNLPDGFFQTDKESLLSVIRAIRKHRPRIVLANSISDRHPDHGKGADLVSKAAYYSGLPKIITEIGGQNQEAWRPQAVYHYIQDYYIPPSFVVDVSEQFETKMAAIKARQIHIVPGDDHQFGRRYLGLWPVSRAAALLLSCISACNCPISRCVVS